MKRSILFILLALFVLSAVKLPAAISAYAFGDYYFVLAHHKETRGRPERLLAAPRLPDL